jgi:hypothetical protein
MFFNRRFTLLVTQSKKLITSCGITIFEYVSDHQFSAIKKFIGTDGMKFFMRLRKGLRGQ